MSHIDTEEGTMIDRIVNTKAIKDNAVTRSKLFYKTFSNSGDYIPIYCFSKVTTTTDRTTSTIWEGQTSMNAVVDFDLKPTNTSGMYVRLLGRIRNGVNGSTTSMRIVDNSLNQIGGTIEHGLDTWDNKDSGWVDISNITGIRGGIHPELKTTSGGTALCDSFTWVVAVKVD